jgi:hypothetical protein
MKNRYFEKQQYDAAFRKIFGRPLSKYIHPLFGFDICKFDEDIQTPHNESLHDFIEKKFGLEALRIFCLVNDFKFDNEKMP